MGNTSLPKGCIADYTRLSSGAYAPFWLPFDELVSDGGRDPESGQVSLHSLLDHPPYAPARLERTLVWPAEAPPVPESVAKLFTGVRVEPGRLTGTP